MLVCYPLYTLSGLRRGSSSDELLHQLDLKAFEPVVDYLLVTGLQASGCGLSLLADFARAFLAHLSTLHLRFLPSMAQYFYVALKGRSAPLKYLSGSKRLGPDCGTEHGTDYHRL